MTNQLKEVQTIRDDIKQRGLLQQSSLMEERLTYKKLEADSILASEILPPKGFNQLPTSPKNTLKNILLTGATGFLGAFLISELLEKTQANIYCLVRAANSQEAEQKIYKNLQSYFLWNRDCLFRLIPVVGDLSQPLMGLSEAAFHKLGKTIDSIYHNGALVNVTDSYSKLRDTNVIGTQEILRFACSGQLKPVHYISSLAVFKSSYYRNQRLISESEEKIKYGNFPDGYAQSKWVGENLVRTAIDRGIPISIYRPGMLTGHSKTGVTKTDSLICRLLKSFIELRSAPILDLMMEMTPIDFVSSAIVNLSLQEKSIGKAFHLVNSQNLPLTKFVKEINSLGYPVREISYDRWQAQLIATIEKSETIDPYGISSHNVLKSLLPLLTDYYPDKPLTYFAKSSTNPLVFDCQNTTSGLLGTSLSCPAINGKLLSTYFSYLTISGFLDVPPFDEFVIINDKW
jgi:thioester reductase-like protein